MLYPFFVIVSFLAASYAFIGKQFKLGLGLIIFAGTFVLLIPNLSSGTKESFVQAFALITFMVGCFVLVYRKKPKEEVKVEEPKVEEPAE